MIHFSSLPYLKKYAIASLFLLHHPQVFINDGAAPLDPVKAGAQLAAAFPYLGDHSQEKIKRIVIHVIDPGVGNASQNPRTLVLRKDGTLFIGPDNGTLSLACLSGYCAIAFLCGRSTSSTIFY